MSENRLTQRLRSIEAVTPASSAGGGNSPSADGYRIRVANDLESRRKAYQLVYKLYLEKEYARPHPSRMWLSIFDALPETVTLLVEKQATGYRPPFDAAQGREPVERQTTGKTVAACDRQSLPSELQPAACGLKPTAVGALTVVFDSPMGLPADGLYKPELDALRASGRRLAEVVSLGVAEEGEGAIQALVQLFVHGSLIARRIRKATDFVVTVNPRHAFFYRRKLLFGEAGPERSYDKVGGAPAVLLRMDFADQLRAMRTCQGPEAATSPLARTPYRFCHREEDEPAVAAALARELRPMCEAEFDFFLMAETDLLARATPEQRAILMEHRRTFDNDALAGCGRKEAVRW